MFKSVLALELHWVAFVVPVNLSHGVVVRGYNAIQCPSKQLFPPGNRSPQLNSNSGGSPDPAWRLGTALSKPTFVSGSPFERHPDGRERRPQNSGLLINPNYMSVPGAALFFAHSSDMKINPKASLF